MHDLYRLTDPTFRLAAGADVLALVPLSYEADSMSFLLLASALPSAFFDLSSGVAGEVVQKLTNYGLRVAVVGADEALWSLPFRQFAAESRQGRTFALFATEAEAQAWLAR